MPTTLPLASIASTRSWPAFSQAASAAEAPRAMAARKREARRISVVHPDAESEHTAGSPAHERLAEVRIGDEGHIDVAGARVHREAAAAVHEVECGVGVGDVGLENVECSQDDLGPVSAEPKHWHGDAGVERVDACRAARIAFGEAADLVAQAVPARDQVIHAGD